MSDEGPHQKKIEFVTFFPIDSFGTCVFRTDRFCSKETVRSSKFESKAGEKRVKPDACMLMGLTAEEANKCKLGNKVIFVFHSLSGIGEV